ncbi:MAG: cell division protein FtsZ [Rhodospirillaceae bacterium]|nr:cell division protein FtsZ [Rhodospirillaceae bacterium]
MTINLTVPPTAQDHLKPRISVIGVGGAGGNAVNNMISSQLEGVEFVVANTDAQALAQTLAEKPIQLGPGITHGLGAGSRPDIGRAAAEEAMEDLMESIGSAHMVFITAGMGGGTGTGAAPVIARIAREHGILTVGVVTKPFQFEGINRMRIAEAGIEEMQQYVDTLIVIPNQNLFRIANEKTTFADAFTMADEVLHSGVRGVTDLMVVPGLINLDFADIRAVMSEMGKAMMGTGEGEGEDRARLAAEAAISNPLLDDVSMKGARGVLINITGGPDMTLFEVDEAANRIGEEVDPDANIIFGSTMDSSIEGKMRVSVVATGIDAIAETQPRPVLKVYSAPQKLIRTPAAEEVAEDAPAMPATATDDAAAAPVAAEPVAQPIAPPAPMTAEPAPLHAPAAVEAPAPAQEAVAAPASAEAVPTPGESAETATTPAAEAPVEAAPVVPAAPAAEAPVTEAAMRPEPRLVAKNDAFMPPPPVNPKATTETPAASDAFKEADLVNGGSADDSRRKGPNLFQRITGAARDARPEMPAARVTPPAARTAPEQPVSASKPEKTEESAPQPAPQQARLSGVDPDDRLKTSQSDDDLLEIPAFLRRQAN